MKQNLHDILKSLRNEINHLPTDDKESKQKLEQLLAGLEKKLETPDETDHFLSEGVRDSITHFEVSYPRVTAILNDVMMALSNMGI